jgi:hypothetical protein
MTDVGLPLCLQLIHHSSAKILKGHWSPWQARLFTLEHDCETSRKKEKWLKNMYSLGFYKSLTYTGAERFQSLVLPG